MISGSTLLPGKRALQFAQEYGGNDTCAVVASKLSRGAIEAAICAPSGGNTQEWIFAVIADPEQRRRVGAIYARASKLVRRVSILKINWRPRKSAAIWAARC